MHRAAFASALLLFASACSEEPPCPAGTPTAEWSAPPLNGLVPTGAVHYCAPTPSETPEVSLWVDGASVHDANMRYVDRVQNADWNRTSDNWYGSLDHGDGMKWSEFSRPEGRLRLEIAAANGGALVTMRYTEGGGTPPVAAPSAAPSPSAAPRGAAAAPTLDAALAVPASAGRRGPDGAAHVVHVFTDYQSPFDARFHSTLEQLLASRNDVQVVMRNNPLPFHREAMGAAQAALAVRAQLGDEGFWAFQKLLYENQRAQSRADLERYAGTLEGLDLARFGRELDQGTHEATVRADMAEAQRIGARGTPTSVIGTTLIPGAQPLPRLTDAL